MLPQFYRFIIVNNSGQTVNFNTGAVNLKVTNWIVDPTTGKITYTQDVDDDLSFDGDENWVDGGELLSDEIDNTANKFLGAQVQLEVTHDEAEAVTAGGFDIYLDGGDATGELSSDATGYASAELNQLRHIGYMTWELSGSDDDVQRSQVFDV